MWSWVDILNKEFSGVQVQYLQSIIRRKFLQKNKEEDYNDLGKTHKSILLGETFFCTFLHKNSNFDNS